MEGTTTPPGDIRDDQLGRLKDLHRELKSAIADLHASIEHEDVKRHKLADARMQRATRRIHTELLRLAGYYPTDANIQGALILSSRFGAGRPNLRDFEDLSARLEGLTGATRSVSTKQTRAPEVPAANSAKDSLSNATCDAGSEPSTDRSVNHRDDQMSVLEAPTPSMDRVSQTDPVWTIRSTQKTPIPVTRLSGEVVWMNPSAEEQRDEPVLTPEEELRIAEVGSSGQMALRSEMESAFAGPSWPPASAIVEPFRRYAIKVFDVNATVCRRAASAQGRDFNQVLGAMVRNLLSDIFGIEWENSPGDQVIRIDWQRGIEGLKGTEIPVVAGNDPDPTCLYHSLIADAIKYRYRFHNFPPDPIPGEPPGINLSSVEWWQYIGLKERHNLAMAIRPYLEDRKTHWQTVHALSRPTDASDGLSEVLHGQETQARKKSRKARKSSRRNTKYEGIGRAPDNISEVRPKNHEEGQKPGDDGHHRAELLTTTTKRAAPAELTPSGQAVEPHKPTNRKRGKHRKNGKQEKLRGEVRSAWLDAKRAEKEWTSDLEIKNNGGPAYNTIRRYRSGARSTRDPYVRQELAKVFGCPVAEVPK